MRDEQHTLQRGFTLIEMIGVLAVIAILGAVVAPKVFDAINDSKIDALAEEISTVKAAVVSYYKDTGVFPYQVTGSATNQDLIKVRTGVKNWKGPYIDKELHNPINAAGNFNVSFSSQTFDINGDGTADYGTGSSKTSVSFITINRLTASQAKALSNILDSDGENLTGNTAWYKAGRVRTYNSGAATANTTLYVFLAAQ